MRAVILKDFGGVENFEITVLPIPTPTSNQVLVKLEAISVNPIDVKTRAGKGIAGLVANEMPAILGWDIAGIITEIGSDVNDFQLGDEVFGMLAFPKLGKAYAEYIVADINDLAIKPKNISFTEAAAAPLAALTAWQAMTTFTKIKNGDRVLIHAASGGVGHYAIQIAKYFGAYVIGTSSSANKDFVLSIGADEHVDYQSQPFENVIADIDFVLDTMGGEYIDRSLKIMKKGSTIVSLPSGLNETVVEKADVLGINGFTIKAKPSKEDMKILASLMSEGYLRSHISKTFYIDQIADAHLQIESGKTVGKIVLTF
ncbi:NADP-dependent oxidoreductase [Pedobacter mucosus]|uniref:NADP-dependent oxidoreductase n=1 Tax=Pedobacter mucosus TaxID=2895286 RepID=UPI001EE3B80A|nr:NADP-dependent oxidoreductase [Pedobacter mucosus]UKT65710.1 NADP-dependent oxidoreductase [Pedobacter mucosus]